MLPAWVLRQADRQDRDWMAELRATVMRPDLERLGRWDPIRVRRRFLDAFQPSRTWVIEVGAQWIEHFYLDPAYQGHGIGSGVLRQLIEAHSDHRPLRLNVLQGSPARRLYERQGFVHEREDPIDVFLVRPASQTAADG